jgi:acyl carrier protein
MDQAEVLQVMKAHFEGGTYEPAELEGFADKKATELLTESIDVVEFVMYLEDKLGPAVDATKAGPAMSSKTFGELAEELSRRMKSGN